MLSQMAGGYGIPGRAEGGPVEGGPPDAPDPAGQVRPGQTPQQRIEDWGWKDEGNGHWVHPETGNRGRFQGEWNFL